ncbi:MAG: hypothetical protein KIY12_08290, partial [Thermoplasmata archaeon]|nr:hypothetical protein [Candidatus Sysuiplasma superficiale]
SMLDRAAFVDVFRDTDASLSERLKAKGGYQREVALRLKYRRLFKSSLQLNLERMSPDERKRITVLSAGNRLARMEDELSALAGGEPGSVIIDIAPRDFLARRRRKGKTEVPILDDDGKVRKLTSLSPIARAVQMHPPQSWGLMVACDPAIRPQISRMAYDAIFG